MGRGRRFYDADDHADRAAYDEDAWEDGEWSALDGTADNIRALPDADTPGHRPASSGHSAQRARARRTDEHPQRTRKGESDASDADEGEDEDRAQADADPSSLSSTVAPASPANRALARWSDRHVVPVEPMDAAEPVIIAGSGISMGELLPKRR